MCGFAGIFTSKGVNCSRIIDSLEKMGNSIAHRGPDSSGIWHEEKGIIGFVHRRLAVVDLSEAGHQPMISHNNRYIIVFNGEVYNHLSLRKEMELINYDISWRGHSDTETLLVGFETWGVETTLKKSVGMFAFALWDNQEKILTLARDRIGEKPLYYGWHQSESERVLLFGSELKAIKCHPAFNSTIDRASLSLFVQHSYIPAPYSIYKGVFKLEPGTILSVSQKNMQMEFIKYWDIKSIPSYNHSTFFKGDKHNAIDILDGLLKTSIRQQMIADVPVGAFLSGGVDSSLVAAIMQSQSIQPIKTFTIGFQERDYNEADYAAEISRHLNTDHTELYVSPKEAMDVIPNLPYLYDEPFADSSQIPTYLISALARRNVSVALSGDGGDELFGGYSRYHKVNKLRNKLKYIPDTMKLQWARLLRSLSIKQINSLANLGQMVLPDNFRNIGHRAHKLADILSINDINQFYKKFITHWHAENVVIDWHEPLNYFSQNSKLTMMHGDYESMMLADLCTYLPDDILVKVDRAAMSVSLETRVPLLDHRIIEFAWLLPLSMKIQDNQGKWIMKQLLSRYVPTNLFERPKMGFGVPVGLWLRGPLRDWAEELLDPCKLRNEGFFRAELIIDMWNQHLSGDFNWEHHLWDILMFQAWLRKQN